MSKLKKQLRKVVNSRTMRPIKRSFRVAKKHVRKGRYETPMTYSIVSAAYNVSAYLGDYFSSIVSQSISLDSLQVILVDDGSTDDTADVIQMWQSKYPGLINYVRKENGGPASARNLGLGLVDSEWVTFIDPDDMIPFDYFEKVDKAIASHEDVALVTVKDMYYYETDKSIRDIHKLGYRFGNANKYIDCSNENDLHIIESMAMSFFKVGEIRRQGLTIDERIRPSFEDGHFVNRYIANLRHGQVAYLHDPVYYYRKRDSADSLTDNPFDSPEKLLIQPKYGYLDLLERVRESRGYVPTNIQRTILYDLSWYIRRLLGKPSACSSLSEEERVEAFELMKDIFGLIDSDVVFGPNIPFLWYEHRLAIVKGFKKELAPTQRVQIKRIMPKTKTVHFALYEDAAIRLDGHIIQPCVKKVTPLTIFGQPLINIYDVYINYTDERQTVEFDFGQRVETKLVYDGQPLDNGITVGEIRDLLTRDWGSYSQQGDIWLVMDRDTQADDNGEHFYRYMMNEHPERECYFVLRKTSPDWERLSDDGFKLVDFGSHEHERLLRKCSAILSSHAEPYVHSYFGDNFHLSKSFIFLQHGVIKTDLSSWLNPKKAIDKMLTTSPAEYESIVSDGSPYRLSEYEVCLTGLPRHDALLKKLAEVDGSRRRILIMPTWRKWLMGATVGKGNDREINEDFIDSDYKKNWEAALNSPILRNLADQGVVIDFFPHANMVPYVEEGLLELPSYVNFAHVDGEKTIQDYFVSASLFITDFSSAIFDAAFAGKPCVYYQFDREEFYSGNHTQRLGYFIDERDGFGPVTYNLSDLETEIAKVVNAGWERDPEYSLRAERTFPFRDGRCSERVYEVTLQSLGEDE